MTPLSFSSRLALVWTIAFGLLLAVVSVAVYVGVRSFLLHDFDAELRTLAGTELASAVDSYRVHVHDFPAEAFPDRSFADKFVQLLAADGAVLTESAPLSGSQSLVERRAMASALAGGAPIFSVTVRDRPGRMVALRTEKDGERFVVAVGMYLEPLRATLARVAWLLAIVWVVSVSLTAVMGVALASRALRPIGRITTRAASIARGNFAARLDPPKTDDEIGRMTRLLNEMLDRLHSAIEANRRFASDASHELRSPLTAMLGEIDVTLKRERSADEYRETLQIVRERLHDVVSLAENLMLLVRAQEGGSNRIGEVSLNAVIGRAVERVTPAAAAAGVSISIELPPLVAYADESLLAHVFDNLLRNAVQYNRPGGRVTLTGRADDVAEGWATGRASIQVTDTGVGLAAADRERVFERFYRVDRSRSRSTGGAGLGLSIVREVVKIFGGSIRVVDTSPAGTTFEVQLPGGRAAGENRASDDAAGLAS